MADSGVAAATRWRKQLGSPADADHEPAKLRVVFLCTGNRFRSPLAAAIFTEAARKHGLPVSVESVGTIDAGSRPAFPETISQAERLGFDVSSHRARHARKVDLSTADVVIGFERSHVAYAVVDAGVPTEKAFTLPELVQLLEFEDVPVRGAEPADGARLAIEQAHARRLALGRAPGSPEIVDPAAAPRRVQVQVADEILDHVDRLVRELFCPSPLST
jgi:protein-tyrosine phosphatase